MNKVFKIIWNNVTQSFVVVSELARNRGKLSSEMKKSNVVNLFKLGFGASTGCSTGLYTISAIAELYTPKAAKEVAKTRLFLNAFTIITPLGKNKKTILNANNSY